ncbi:MAG TPA: cupredoxin domain-containing protein [Acidimicrobiales bacterium]|jgi:plastocyanin|nr:cupredoxin domain-containing protein [Acidimicrobiales bacterium]
MAGLLGLVLLVTLTGCGGSSSKTTVLGGKNLTADVVVDKVDGLHTYDPKKLTIELNKEVSFTVLNKDKVVHNVTIPDFAIDMDVQPGQRIEVKLPAVAQAPRDGFFLFYCKYHQSEGEAGRIEVSR